MKATPKRIVGHTELQEHLPAELTVKHTAIKLTTRQLQQKDQLSQLFFS
jgi:hypothetical protein